MDANVFACQAIFPDNGVKTMADKGVNLQFHSQELNEKQWMSLLALKGGFVALVVAPVDTPVENVEIPDITPEFKGEKSPSQRMKAVIYRLWEENGKHGEFEVYYRAKMDALIEKLKEQI